MSLRCEPEPQAQTVQDVNAEATDDVEVVTYPPPEDGPPLATAGLESGVYGLGSGFSFIAGCGGLGGIEFECP